MIGRLIVAGVDVFRLNFSHGSAEHHQRVAGPIQKQARHNRYVGVLADPQGPKIRIAGSKTVLSRLRRVTHSTQVSAKERMRAIVRVAAQRPPKA